MKTSFSSPPPVPTSVLKTKAWIAGHWMAAKSGARFSVKNPATQEILAEVADVGSEEAHQAIEAAAAAGPAWRARLAKERAQFLRAWFEQILLHREDLALLMTLEQGKPLNEARAEVDHAASFVEWFAEEAKRVYGDVVPTPWQGKRLWVTKQPIGVVAAITPWNFPLAMVTRKCAPALAVGCTVVLKPAEETPLSALALAFLAERAGLPAGVLNVIPSSQPAKVGEVLTTHPWVRKVSFTGSTAVGKLLMKQSAGTLKKLSLELGGNAPFLVFADADLEQAVQGAVASKYRNTGQTCICTNRFLVADAVYDQFVAKLVQRVQALRVGAGWEEGTQIGPLINPAAVQKVQTHLADALQQGAQCVLGGSLHALGGTFFTPTVLTEAHAGMQLAQEETFGPVAPIFRFSSEEEALREANRTPYGLAAYVYTQQLSRVFLVAEALECGMVGINEGLISTEVAPFGGIKESGVGREGSKYGIDDYLETKYLCLGGLAKNQQP